MIKLFAGVLGLWLSLSAAQAADLQPFTIDLVGWSRMPSPAFGCRLETAFGHRDPKFNCGLTDYKPATTPCVAGVDYMEGPALPSSLAPRVHPRATQVDIEFEHGALRSVLVVLQGTFTREQVIRALGLADDGKLPENIISVSVEPSTTAGSPTTQVSIQGFEHMGAADVDCPVSDIMAADPAPTRELVAAVAANLEKGTVDLDRARIALSADTKDGHASLCTRDARFVASLKGQLLMQIFGAYVLEGAAGLAQHQPPPAIPSTFDANGRGDVELKDLMFAPEPLVRLGEALTTLRPLLIRYRTAALAGIDDLLRFEALEPLLTAEERDELGAAYWSATLRVFHARPAVRAALGEIAPCYGEAYFLENVKVADRDSGANLSPLGHYYLMFWLRRKADGHADLVRLGLTMVREALGP
jgi:hypothetical protein